MKLIFICIFTLFTSIQALKAQNDIKVDTIRSITTGKETYADEISAQEKELSPNNTKSFEGFLLDMGLLKITAPKLPKFTLEIPDASKDYSRIFQLNPDIVYSQGLSNIFSLSNSQYYGSNPFGLTGFGNPVDNLQMSSFKLKNGMRINTYGEYNKDGWKVPNRSALPWERNNFKGAFELKSANGSFGIRIEVQQGRSTPY